MIVPEHWAEAQAQQQLGGRQITLRRLGWSMRSAEDAQAMAEARVAEALQRSQAGESLPRRERKQGYSGAAGLPIREEVLSRWDEEVITRNSYGARCLNTPHALFADVDFEPLHPARKVFAVLGLLIAPLALLLGRAVQRARAPAPPDEAAVRTRLQRFLQQHPAWTVRLYVTPKGLRLLATHQRFDPAAPEVQAFFDAVGADPVYVRMCQNQRCFRARLSAKPWRIGLRERLRPSHAAWPLAPALQPQREHWVAQYEQAAAGYAACRWIETLGSGQVHPSLRAVVELHDRESRALQPGLKLA